MITVEDLRKHEGEGLKLACSNPRCGAEYSADPANYWDLPDTHVFKCECGTAVSLVRIRRVVEVVKA
jgi:hypothetical protein